MTRLLIISWRQKIPDLNSARITKDLRETLNPGRYESIQKELDSFFSSEQYRNLLNDIETTHKLSKPKFQTFGIQLMMASILSNGHRAEVGTIMKHEDLSTLRPHSSLAHMYTVELNKYVHKPF